MSAFSSIVAIGEIFWDMLPSGPQMSGAPANFSCHARALGAEARLVSRVGKDDPGSEIFARLGALGVWTDCISEDALRPTGTVSVVLDGGMPRYVIRERVAWDFIEVTPSASAAINTADAVYFGTLAQRSEQSRAAIRAVLTAAAPVTLRMCDVNLRQQYHTREILTASLALANIVKFNDAELPVLAATFGLNGDTREQLTALMTRFALKLIVLTRGANGSIIYDGEQWSEHSGIRTEVRGTDGASDAFAAAIIMGILAGWPLNRINATANELAAFVCAHPGATPLLSRQLAESFNQG